MTIRSLVCCVFSAACFLPLASIPASAAPSDAAMLRAYAGSYTGTGQLNSNPPQTVRCRLVMTPSGAASIDYTGRCSAGGVGFNMTGVISAAGGRITASMSGTGGGFTGSGTINGARRGDAVVFSSKGRDVADGHDRSVSSSFALTGGTVSIEFSVLDNKTGKTMAGTIPFTKAAAR